MNDIEIMQELKLKISQQEDYNKRLEKRYVDQLKQLFNKHSVRLDRMREWYDLQRLESRVLTDIEKLIKELENE